MFLSKITRIVNRDQSDGEITDLAVKVGRYQFAINSLIVLGFCLIGREFLSLWVGEVYNDAYICILLVIIPGVFYNSLQIANSTLIAKNLIKYQAMVQLVMGITNVVLSMVFSSCWGAVGAALSICISYIVRVVLTIILIKLKLNINLLEFLKKCYIKMSIPFFPSVKITEEMIKEAKQSYDKMMEQKRTAPGEGQTSNGKKIGASNNGPKTQAPSNRIF
jgi:O-antigen/teichoic acid export membrane protein